MSLEWQAGFTIGPWRVDPLKGAVEHETGVSRHLEPKVMEVLVCLARHANQLVTRSDLLDVVWDGHIASDELLTRAVSEIRRTMNLQDGAPCHIQTVPKRGYCLVGEVSFQRTTDDAHSAPAREKRSEIRVAMSGAFLIGVTLIALVYYSIDSITLNTPESIASDMRSDANNTERRADPYPAPRPIALTNSEGFEYQPALSPNANFVAYVSRAVVHPMTQTDLVVQQTRGGSPLQLTHSAEYEYSPAWSPDGTRLAYLRADKSNVSHAYELLEMPAMGGIASKLADIGVNSGGLDWSPDGSMLAVGRRVSHNDRFSIAIYSWLDGSLTDLSATGTPGGEWRPRFSPDGTTIAFMRRSKTGNQICVRRIFTEIYDCVTPDNEGWSLWDFDWTPDGKAFFLVLGARAGGRWMAAMPVEGGDVVPLSFGDQAKYVDVADQTNQLVYSAEFRDQNIWLAPGPNADAGATVAKLPGASTRDDIWPAFSPDGTRIAFISARTSFSEVWVANVDGSNLIQLTQMGASYWPRWSPDGASIVFSSRGYPGITENLEQMHFRPGTMESYIVDATEGPAQRLFSGINGMRHTSFSSDGLSLFYEIPTGNDCRRSIWKIHRDSGDTSELTNCGFRPLEGHDGRVYFMRGVDQTIYSMNADGDDVQSVLSTQEYGCVTPMWAWDLWVDKLVFIDCTDVSFKALDIVTGDIEELVAPFSKSGSPSGDLTVSSDGRWLAFGKVDHAGSDLYLVDGFR